jgi:hypothetical protein
MNLWKRPLLAAFLLLGPAAHAAPLQGTLYDCSGTVGGTAANISFPKAGTAGPSAPTVYLSIQNNSTSAQIVWFSPLPGVTATTAPPSWQLVPTSGYDYTSTDPVPQTVSIIASASSAVYTCHYQ